MSRALSEIDRFATWLEQEADGFSPRSPGSFAAGSGSGDPQSPSPVIDMVDALYADLVRAETRWRQLQGYPATRRTALGRTAHDRSVTIAFLSSHLASILRAPEMVSHVGRVLRWRTVLRAMTRAETERRSRPGRCPRCHMVAVLHNDDETETIRCRNCPVVLTEDEYAAEVVAAPDAAVVAESRRARSAGPS